MYAFAISDNKYGQRRSWVTCGIPARQVCHGQGRTAVGTALASLKMLRKEGTEKDTAGEAGIRKMS